jgi:hypothetical protein
MKWIVIIALGVFGANLLTTLLSYGMEVRLRYLKMKDALRQIQKTLPPQVGGSAPGIKMISAEDFAKMANKYSDSGKATDKKSKAYLTHDPERGGFYL